MGAKSFRRVHRGYAQIVTYQYEHVMKAEKVLGRDLRDQELVHHVDENKLNNENTNLVICPDRGYHSLIHYRMRALAECGNAGWFQCKYCKEWDSPENVRVLKTDGSRPHQSSYHMACARAVANRNYRLRKESKHGNH